LTPASINLPIIAAESVAGPRVEMIFVLRKIPPFIPRRLKRLPAEWKILIGPLADRNKSGLPFWRRRAYSAPNFELNFMADAANKYPENIAGKYYVDNQCIDCDLCRETAPDNFKRNDDGGYSVVYKQPASPEEEARCKEAMEGCPVEAIGNNG
jgi:ferredoxin